MIFLDARIRKFYFAISSVLKHNYLGFEKLIYYIIEHKCLLIIIYGCDARHMKSKTHV